MKKNNLVWGILAIGLSFTACKEQTKEMAVQPESKTAGARIAATQSTADLKTAYSGTADFTSSSGTLTFKTSGAINFTGRPAGENSRWDVPADVKVITINSNVTVTGQFTVATGKTVLIKGIDRITSKIYGTKDTNYLKNYGGDFVTFKSTGSGSKINIENLTSLNPKGWHSRSEPLSGADMTIKNCRFIDDRKGSSNNSDGNHNASLIENCYFSTGDDVFCDYSGKNQKIVNCTVNLIENSLPIQFGYEGPSRGDNTLTIENLIITGNQGRKGSPLIQCRQKNPDNITNTVKATKTININGLYFRPSVNNVAVGHIIRSDDKSCAYKGTWTNVNMALKGYYSDKESNSSISICGSTSKTTKTFSCGTPPKLTDALK